MVECPKCHYTFQLEYQCKRCGHKWRPREDKAPKVCPKCKSPYWDKERREKKAKVK